MGLHLLYCILRLFSDFYRSLMPLRWYARPESSQKKRLFKYNYNLNWNSEESAEVRMLRFVISNLNLRKVVCLVG